MSFLIEYEVLAWRFGGNLLHALACSRKAFCRPSPKSVRVVGSLEDVELAHGAFLWERKFRSEDGENLLSFDASSQSYFGPQCTNPTPNESRLDPLFAWSLSRSFSAIALAAKGRDTRTYLPSRRSYTTHWPGCFAGMASVITQPASDSAPGGTELS